MAKGKKKQESSSESSESESSVSTSSSQSESSEEETSSSSSDDNRKKSSKKSTKKSSPKKDSKKSKKSTKESPKKRKKKAKKDPNAPKKATSAYFYFAAKRRDEFKKANSTLSMLEKSAQIGVDWKALSEKDRAPFVKLAEEDKKRHAKEKANYTPPAKDSDSSDSSSDEDKPKKKKQKKDKDPNAPKRNMNAYMFYAADNRAALKEKSPGLKPTEVTSTLGAQWKALSEAGRKPYEKKAADDKTRYEEAMTKYSKGKK
jgi:hypothetical protein